MLYVNMHDTALSGWGKARDGRSLLSIRCDTWAQAEAIEKAAKERPEMKRVGISRSSRMGREGDHLAIKDFEEMGGPWLQYVGEE